MTQLVQTVTTRRIMTDVALPRNLLLLLLEVYETGPTWDMRLSPESARKIAKEVLEKCEIVIVDQ